MCSQIEIGKRKSLKLGEEIKIKTDSWPDALQTFPLPKWKQIVKQ